MGKQNPNTDPLGILKENGKSIPDPLGILKKKESTEVGTKDSSLSSEVDTKKPLSKGEEAITNRLETSSKLPSNIPEISSREQTLSKAGELSHDIESLKNSEMYESSIKVMKDLEESAKLTQSLEPQGSDKLDLTNEGEVNAYNILVKQYNNRRNEHLAKEENSQESLKFLNTFDNYVKEYNSLLKKAKEGSTQPGPKKSESFAEILSLAYQQTDKADMPAALLYEKVAKLRQRSHAMDILKKETKLASGRYKDRTKDIRALDPSHQTPEYLTKNRPDKALINVESAKRLKDAVEATTEKITKLENDKSKLNRILEKGGIKSIGEKQTIKLDPEKLKSEIAKIDSEIQKLKPTEKKQEDAWNAYMKPILDKTATKATLLAEEAQELQEWGQKEFGSKLRLTTGDVDGFITLLEYIAAQTAKAAPYSIHGALTLGTGMIDIEQGSIEGDILTSLAKKKGISVAEVIKSGIDQKGAKIAFEEGVKAGLWEFAGESATLLVPWAKLGLAAKTVIPKNALVRLINTSLGVIGKLTGSGTVEALTEMKQTDIELTAKYKALGYTPDQIKNLITQEDYIESGAAGFAASFGLSGPSTFLSTVQEVRAENILLAEQERKAQPAFEGKEYKEKVVEIEGEKYVSIGNFWIDPEKTEGGQQLGMTVENLSDIDFLEKEEKGFKEQVKVDQEEVDRLSPILDFIERGIAKEDLKASKEALAYIQSKINQLKPKEQVIDDVRESIDRDNLESVEEAVQLIEDKVNQELDAKNPFIGMAERFGEAAKEAKKNALDFFSQREGTLTYEEAKNLSKEEKEKLNEEYRQWVKNKEVETATESTQQKTDSESADSTAPIYKVGNKEYDVKVEGGTLSILDKEGNEPSKHGRKKITAEYEENLNYLEGDESIDLEGDINEEEGYMNVANTSNNPAEVVEHYVYASNVEDIEGDYKKSQMAENMPPISREDFARENEEEITFGLARTYLKNRKDKSGKKRGTSDLDQAAQELSEKIGIEVTDQDIVDFMIAYPNGYKGKSISESAKRLSNRFEDLTGLKLTPKTIERVAEQRAEQEGVEINNQDYETETEAEDEYFAQLAKEKDKQSAKRSSIPEGTEEIKAGDKLMQEGKDQVSKGLAMFSKASKPSGPLSSSFIGFTHEQVEAIQEIGSGLIKQGLATAQNVAQKVKDYFKEQGVVLPEGLLEKVYPVSTKKPLTDKTEGETLKEELEKDVEKKNKEGKSKKKKGKYIQRMLADERRVPEFKELLKDQEEYTEHDLGLAESRSVKFIKDFQNKFGEKEGLLEVAKILKANKKSEGFPEIMIGPISSKLETMMEKLGMREEALSIVKFKQEEARKAGRLLVGIREDASPDEVISILRDNIRTEKLEKINEEYKDGKTYNQALKEMQTRIDELEAAYKKLEETGKIDESFLPDPDISTATTKSKELKARAKKLRKKGSENLSAYFKSQRGGLSMGLKVDDKLITALGQILQSYVLEFQGNVLAAFDKFKTDVAKNYKELSKEDIDNIKTDLLAQSKEVIDEFKNKKKQQIINEILKPDKKETKAQRDARKEASENILSDLNEGKSIEEVSDNLSEIAKFDKIDPQVLDDILLLAVEYGDLLNDGKLELASTKFDELMDKLYALGLESRSFNEVIMDLWYTAVLSGLTTVRRSLFGSGITSAVFMGFRFLMTPSMAPIMWTQMVKGSKGLFQNYAHVLQTGKSNVQITDFKIKRGSYTAMLWRTKFKDLSALNGAVKGAWAIPTFVFRNIVAWDQVLKNATSEANYALYEFENTSKDKTKKQRIKETEDKLRNDKDEEIQNIVQAEIADRKAKGEKIELGYKFRRFTEIKNEFRDSEIIKKSMEDAAEAAMVGAPKGTLGRIYKGVISKIEIKPEDTLKIKAGKTMFKFTFPFFRIGFNWINAGLDFTPVGFSRGLSDQVWTKDGMIDRTSFQKRELIAKATTGFLLTSSIMLSMFDWDEEEGIKLKDEKDMWIKVYGPLTGDYKNLQDISLDAIPWSIQIKNIFTGEWTEPLKYQDNPIGFALAPIGVMHDEMYFNQFRKDKDDPIEERKLMFLLNGIGMGTFTYAMDKSFNQGINNLFKVVTADSVEDMGRSLKSLVLNPVEGFYPGIYNQLYAQYRAMSGTPEKQYREWYERLPSKVPLVDGIIKNDRVDVFGYPFIKDFDFPFFPDFILKTATENLDYRENIKSWNLLHKYDNVVLGRFKPPKRDKYKNKLTNQQMDEYMVLAGKRMRKYVEDNYSNLNKKDRKKLQEKLWEYKRKSAQHAKRKISNKNP